MLHTYTNTHKYSFYIRKKKLLLIFSPFLLPFKVGLQIETPTRCTSPSVFGGRQDLSTDNLPKALTLEEKKFLLAVERGDLANVRR